MIEKKIDLSIVIPVYHSQEKINELYIRLLETISKVTPSYEIIFVEDGSKDKSWEIISSLASKDSNIKAIKLARNFGQHNAISGGLQLAKGNYVVVMDCDLQDKPEEIGTMYHELLKNGGDLIVGRRFIRKDNFLKRWSSALFYKLFNCLTGLQIDQSVANFGVYSRKVINAFLMLKTQYRFFPIDIKLLGFDCRTTNITHGKRGEGKSSYNFYKLFSLAINNIIYFSTKPLKAILLLGLIISLMSFSLGFYYIIRTFFVGVAVQGWTTLIVSLFFLSGVTLVSLGTLGLYIQKIFEETQNRPIYIIDKTINVEVQKNKAINLVQKAEYIHESY